MKLPNGESAIVDIAKLRDYCLSPLHPEGKHKARVFQAALGLDASHAELLRDLLLKAARDEECEVGEESRFGVRFSIEIKVQRGLQQATVKSAWIIRAGEQIPRLVSAYVV